LKLADKKSEEMHLETKRKKNIREACRLAGILSNLSMPSYDNAR